MGLKLDLMESTENFKRKVYSDLPEHLVKETIALFNIQGDVRTPSRDLLILLQMAQYHNSHSVYEKKEHALLAIFGWPLPANEKNERSVVLASRVKAMLALLVSFGFCRTANALAQRCV
ncbi:hypothetical protein EVAR_38707_1 [Eumeta japonica]|uniref:Uncharacterized protein n=1 Tax=Eumeta variegata TaxID=151549 RepID=A0A4C1XM76_EUMVA|nr:hypothetical protein EVAR_38707_1 [Eumeta japonica]